VLEERKKVYDYPFYPMKRKKDEFEASVAENDIDKHSDLAVNEKWDEDLLNACNCLPF
jgi:hypothetical protein